MAGGSIYALVQGGYPSRHQLDLSMCDGTVFVVMTHGDHCHLLACPLDSTWITQQQHHLKELHEMGVLTQHDYETALNALAHTDLPHDLS